MSVDGALSDVVGYIYDSVGNATLWPEVLRRVQSALHADATIQLEASAATPSTIKTSIPEPTHVLGLDLAAAEAYAGLAPASPLAAKVMRLEAGRPMSAYALMDRSEFERTEICQRWVRPLKMQDAVFAMLSPAGPRSAVLNLMRSDTHLSSPYESDPSPGQLLPHLSRAYRLNLRLERAACPSLEVEALLQGFATPVFLICDEGRVGQLNGAAERLLAEADGLSLEPGRLLAAATTWGRRALQGMLAKVRLGEAAAASVERPSGRMALCLTGAPLRGERREAADTISGRRRSPSVLVVASEPDRGWSESERADLQTRLKTLYELTPAESAVAVLIAQCGSLPAVAVNLGVRHSTVATHAQRVFAKMGARNQGEVCRRLEFLGMINPIP